VRVVWRSGVSTLAFVLNHLLLKCVWRPQWTQGYLHCFAALAASTSPA
jgi:hypothetical protein